MPPRAAEAAAVPAGPLDDGSASAIARTPSRAAPEMVLWMKKARPNSAMPKTSTIKIGTTRANSTAAAPRSDLMRRRSMVRPLSVCR